MAMVQMARKTVDFNKIMFDSSYVTLVTLQDYVERALGEQSGRMVWISEEGKNNADEMYEILKQCRDSFKHLVDDGFERLEQIMPVTLESVNNEMTVIKAITAPKAVQATE